MKPLQHELKPINELIFVQLNDEVSSDNSFSSACWSDHQHRQVVLDIQFQEEHLPGCLFSGYDQVTHLLTVFHRYKV